tara:strand:+ start:9525 stop:9911 length:387 start_codon:yes stop_codon:yes gene_type:complete
MIKIDISVGELLDKISILEIKKAKIKDSEKLLNVTKELELLSKKAEKYRALGSSEYDDFMSSLLETNNKLWEIEDEIRIHEKEKQFNENFIELARKVYINNDERFAIKSSINKFYDSGIKEEKEYVDY